jgi:hypothetical protein
MGHKNGSTRYPLLKYLYQARAVSGHVVVDRNLKGQFRMDNPETLATLDTGRRQKKKKRQKKKTKHKHNTEHQNLARTHIML